MIKKKVSLNKFVLVPIFIFVLMSSMILAQIPVSKIKAESGNLAVIPDDWSLTFGSGTQPSTAVNWSPDVAIHFRLPNTFIMFNNWATMESLQLTESLATFNSLQIGNSPLSFGLYIENGNVTIISTKVDELKYDLSSVSGNSHSYVHASEPSSVDGADSWNYADGIITVNGGTGTNHIIITWGKIIVFPFTEETILLFLGLCGIVMLISSFVVLVKKAQAGDVVEGIEYGATLFILGISFMIVWLWH